MYQRRRWNRNTTLEPYCNVPWFYKFYLKCRVSFSVVDLYVSGISARCNQATVAFLRLLISTLFFSITQVTWCSYFIFFKTVFLLPQRKRDLGVLAGNERIAQLLRRMKQNNSHGRQKDGQNLVDQQNQLKIIIL